MLFLQLNGGMIKESAALGAQTNRLATASSGAVPKDFGRGGIPPCRSRLLLSEAQFGSDRFHSTLLLLI